VAEDEKETQDAESEGESEGKDDVAALTSKFQSDLAHANKTIKELSSQRADAELRLNELQEKITQVKEAVPLDEDASPEAKAAVKALQEQVSTLRQMGKLTFDKWTDAESERHALRLAMEYEAPDEVEKLKRRFHEVAKQGEQALLLDVKEAEIELKSGALEKKAPPKRKYDENVQSGRSSPNVLDEMAEIDVTTPEGRAKWASEKAKFARKAGLPSPT